jgi:hypothetical protein
MMVEDQIDIWYESTPISHGMELEESLRLAKSIASHSRDLLTADKSTTDMIDECNYCLSLLCIIGNFYMTLRCFLQVTGIACRELSFKRTWSKTPQWPFGIEHRMFCLLVGNLS